MTKDGEAIVTTTTVDIAKLSNSKVHDILEQALGRQTWLPAEEAFELLHEAVGGASDAAMTILWADLDLMVLSRERGPLSFERIVEPDQETVAELEGQSFLYALASSKISRKALQAMIRYGELLTYVDLPQQTKLTGVVINALASAAIATRFGEPFSDSEARTTSAILAELAVATSVPGQIRTMASQSVFGERG